MGCSVVLGSLGGDARRFPEAWRVVYTKYKCALASRDIPNRSAGRRASHGAARAAPPKKVS